MRLLIIGPPGSGKGTQAARISGRLGIPTISTGDIFRENVKNLTFLGRQARKFLDNGDFVPDEITNGMVRERLSQKDVEGGFLLDGYPRTSAQVTYLEMIMAKAGLELDAVLQLMVEDDEIVSRLLARAMEFGRSDDTAPVIQHRLDLYHRQTELVVTHYSEGGLLHQVDGTGTVSEVTDRAIHAIKATTR